MKNKWIEEIDYHGFFIDEESFVSYNKKSDETFLRFNDFDKKINLILKGDWCNEYGDIAHKGLAACIDFYNSKKDIYRSPWSEDLDLERYIA